MPPPLARLAGGIRSVLGLAALLSIKDRPGTAPQRTATAMATVPEAISAS
jgi:hypothetical protein